MKSIGDDYEAIAIRWLSAQGLAVVRRNYRCRVGELDLVARDGPYLVFIEVRGRSNPRYASAAASVDPRKRRRLVRAARFFLQQHPQLAELPCRFDVIAFEPRQSATGQAPRWIRSAFTD